MANNTGNPIGSTAAKDLSDNAANLDWFSIGTEPEYKDRLGRNRKSLKGMEVEFVADQAGRASSFNNYLEGTGFEVPVDYVAGLSVVRPTQIIRHDGELYRAKDRSLPFVTTEWELDTDNLLATGDAVLRQQLSNPNEGAGLVMLDRQLEYDFDSAGFALHSSSKLNTGGNSLGLLSGENVRFYDPLARSASVEILPGSPVSIFDNSTSFGPLFGTGRYTQDANGITKISGTGSSVLLLPATYGADIDMQICMRSLFELGGADSGSPKDAKTAIMLRMQSASDYAIIQVQNSHLITASLDIRESVEGVENVLATYGNIVVSADNPKMSNVFPVLRVILRKNRVTVSLNGVCILKNIILKKLRWGRHGLRVFKQGANIKDFYIHEQRQQAAPALTVHNEGLLYGDGNKYVGWADCASLNDGTVFVVWRESDLDTPSGGHQRGGRIVGAKWKGGKLVTTPITHFAQEGNSLTEYQEQDCVLSKVYYNGNDHLVMFTRRFRNSPSDNKCYVNFCNLGINDPSIPANWPARTEITFPTVLQFVAGHSHVLMAADGVTFITAFYGTRVGHTAYACVVATSTDLVSWTIKSIPVDPLATSNPITSGDAEPSLMRGPGESLFLYARSRTMVSHDDGLTWGQYDLLGGSGGVARHFPAAIRTERGGLLMYRRYTNPATPADAVIVPLQINDGFSWRTADFKAGVVIGTQYDGADMPGKANTGGDGGCLRCAYLGADKYFVMDYRQRVNEMAPRLYQYIISAS